MNETEKSRPNQKTLSKRNWWNPAVCCAFLVVATTAHAASIFTNPITNSNPSASNPFNSGQTVDPNATASGIGRGAGLTANAGGDRYNAASWNLPSLDPTDYFTWTMTPNSGYELDFASFVYTGQRSNTGPNTFAFRSSVDGFTSNIGAPHGNRHDH